MNSAKIIGTGSYLPEKVLTNKDLEKMVDTSDEWITKRTGIKERHIASDDQASSDLAVEAIKEALKDADLKPKDLDLILISTITPDTAFPSTGCWVQKKLGIKNIPAFDVSAACSGFLYGLTVANSFIESGLYENIALVGVETLSKIVDWEDRSTCVLLGDGAGAVILQKTQEDDKSGIISSYLGADGSKGHLLIQEAGGSLNPASHDTVEKGMHYFKMEGRETFRNAVRVMKQSSLKALKKADLKSKNLDLVITHQANIRIIDSLAKRLKAKDKAYVTVDKHGNTSAASIPLALDDANKSGHIDKGDYLLLTAFGGGLTWGSVVLRW